MDDDPEIVLLFHQSGAGSVEVRARNDGAVAYVYRTYYAACELSYHTDTGRRFLVPEGTHCDLVNHATFQPGATVTLFEWGLEECTRDSWGCSEERDLPPGLYHVRGSFCAEDPGYTGNNCRRESLSGATLRIA